MNASVDVICFSHLRWGFVFQRPNHLMSRLGRRCRVFFFEEPVFRHGPPSIEETNVALGVVVVTPYLSPGFPPDVVEATLRTLVRELRARHAITRPLLWFYTPMALPLVEGSDASAVVYDCMEDLTGAHGAPPELAVREHVLLQIADVVFTGGQSLYEAKAKQAPNVHCFPSSVDVAHFGRARQAVVEPEDQRGIPSPRVGWFGVIDERLDVELLARVAAQRPHYHFVMIGPAVKIDPATLPRRSNIHWLGQRSYESLPGYVAHWDVAMMPFALNRATQFISPTKTLEYLAAGRPVVSTAIRDVEQPYGRDGLVRIAGASDFAAAIDALLVQDKVRRLAKADELLARTSWDRTFDEMMRALDEATGALMPRFSTLPEAHRASQLAAATGDM